MNRLTMNQKVIRYLFVWDDDYQELLLIFKKKKPKMWYFQVKKEQFV